MLFDFLVHGGEEALVELHGYQLLDGLLDVTVLDLFAIVLFLTSFVQSLFCKFGFLLAHPVQYSLGLLVLRGAVDVDIELRRRLVRPEALEGLLVGAVDGLALAALHHRLELPLRLPVYRLRLQLADHRVHC